MKISCQEVLVSGATFAEKLVNLEKYGFDGIELNGHELHDPAKLEERVKAFKNSPVKPSSICGGAPAEIVHPDPAKRRATVDALKRFLDISGQLGATGPITVPIFNHNQRVPDLSPYKSQHQLEIELLVEMMKEVGAHAVKAKATMLLEPLNRYESNSLADVAEAASVVRKVGPGLKVMADFFHMHIEELSTPRSIAAIGDLIGHVHLADNTRKEPGTGDIDFTAGFAALKKAKFTGYMALECGLSDKSEIALPRCAKFLKQCIAEA